MGALIKRTNYENNSSQQIRESKTDRKGSTKRSFMGMRDRVAAATQGRESLQGFDLDDEVGAASQEARHLAVLARHGDRGVEALPPVECEPHRLSLRDLQ